MLRRCALVILAFAAVASSVEAARSKEYDQWGLSPVRLLMTKMEQAAWSSVVTDEDAKRFIELFWARRDPTPDTPANEFRAEVEHVGDRRSTRVIPSVARDRCGWAARSRSPTPTPIPRYARDDTPASSIAQRDHAVRAEVPDLVGSQRAPRVRFDTARDTRLRETALTVAEYAH